MQSHAAGRSPRRQQGQGPGPGQGHGFPTAYQNHNPNSNSNMNTNTTPRRRGVASPRRNSDFVDFLHQVIDMLFLPITYPLARLRDLLTSPLTISVILKAVLMVVLIVISAVASVAAVGAFWWSWGTGGNVEIEGWLVYGSREHRTPHALLQLPPDRFQEDLPYDIQVELELVRPSPGAEEMGNFMVTLELRSIRAPEMSIIRAAQPSLPPPPLPSSVFMLPTFPSYFMPPCIIPWPLRSLCPGRLLGYSGNPAAKIKERRRKGTLVSPARGNEVVLLTKELLEGVVVYSGRGDSVGSLFVSIGREDTHPHDGAKFYREVRTTGWVVVRWFLTSNPIPPLILLPPLSLSLTLTSAFIGFVIMTFIGRKKPGAAAKSPGKLTGKVTGKLERASSSPSPAKRASPSDRDPRPASGIDRPLFEHEALDDVLDQHSRAWAALERRRRSPDNPSPRRSAGESDTGDTPRRPAGQSTGLTPTETTESGTGTAVTGSVTETEEMWDESESWESSNEDGR